MINFTTDSFSFYAQQHKVLSTYYLS